MSDRVPGFFEQINRNLRGKLLSENTSAKERYSVSPRRVTALPEETMYSCLGCFSQSKNGCSRRKNNMGTGMVKPIPGRASSEKVTICTSFKCGIQRNIL